MKLPFRNVEGKALRIWLRISLIPYIIVILAALYGFFVGIEFFGITDGVDGAWLGVLLVGGCMTIVPVLPAAIIFQIFAFAGIKMKRAGASKKNKVKVNLTIIGIFVAIGLGILCCIYANAIKSHLAAPKARRFVENAECVIEYEKTTPHSIGPFGITEYKHNIIALDYDTMRIGFIRHSYYDEADYFKLEKVDVDDPRLSELCEENKVKADFRGLEEPGKSLVLLSMNGNENCIGGVILFMEDGTIWFTGDHVDGRFVPVVISDLDLRVDEETYYNSKLG